MRPLKVIFSTIVLTSANCGCKNQGSDVQAVAESGRFFVVASAPKKSDSDCDYQNLEIGRYLYEKEKRCFFMKLEKAENIASGTKRYSEVLERDEGSVKDGLPGYELIAVSKRMCVVGGMGCLWTIHVLGKVAP